MNQALAVDIDADAPDLTIEREYAHPVERVFAACTDQASIGKWIGPADFKAPDTEFDARRGSAYMVPMVAPDGAVHTARGVVQQLIPNELLQLTWAWDQEDGSPGQPMLLTLTFEPTESGSRLTLHHANFVDAEARDQHNHGWSGSLEKLADFLAAWKSNGPASITAGGSQVSCKCSHSSVIGARAVIRKIALEILALLEGVELTEFFCHSS